MCVTVCNMSPVVRFISLPDLDLLIAKWGKLLDHSGMT